MSDSRALADGVDGVHITYLFGYKISYFYGENDGTPTRGMDALKIRT